MFQCWDEEGVDPEWWSASAKEECAHQKSDEPGQRRSARHAGERRLDARIGCWGAPNARICWTDEHADHDNRVLTTAKCEQTLA